MYMSPPLSTCTYRTASLLRPARCYTPPPPYFRAKLLYRIILPPLHAPPPRRAARASLPYCSSACTCTRVASVEELYLCIKRVENSLRTGLGLFADLGRFPEVVIVPSRPVGGVWLRDYLLCFATCTWPTTLPSFSTATACRSKEFSSSTALQSTRIRGRGGEGGLNCEAKAQVLVVTPPPLFFLKVGRKKGGRNSGAVRYMYMYKKVSV